MSQSLDATLKALVESGPAAWVKLAGGPAGANARAIDADVSTVSAAADKVVRVEGERPWLLHVEFQSRAADHFLERLHFYHAALRHRHHLPVVSVVVPLVERAEGEGLDGLYVADVPLTGGVVQLPYVVVRPWRLPVDDLLAGDPVLVPLAALAATRADLRGVTRRISQRLQPVPDGPDLMAAALNLLNSRFGHELVRAVVLEVNMEFENDEYTAFVDSFKADGMRRALILTGTQRLGPPDATTVATLEAIDTLEPLEDLLTRLNHAAEWAELVTPHRDTAE